MQKGAAPLFVILAMLILAGLGGGYVYFNKPLNNPLPQITSQIPAVNKTYQNQQFNFELTYPVKDLKVLEDSEGEFNKRGGGDFRKNFKGYVMYEPGKVLRAVIVLGKDNSFDLAPFSVWVFDNPQELSSSQWFEKYWYYPFIWGVFAEPDKGHIRPESIATVSGQITKYGVAAYQPGSPKFLYLTLDKRIYLLRMVGSEGDKILQSFKFLK